MPARGSGFSAWSSTRTPTPPPPVTPTSALRVHAPGPSSSPAGRTARSRPRSGGLSDSERSPVGAGAGGHELRVATAGDATKGQELLALPGPELAAGPAQDEGQPGAFEGQLEQLIGGQLDHQLVDGAARTPFEDVDADHVTPDGADAAGDGAQGAGPVGEPHPGHVLLHTRTVRVPYERRVSRPRNADYRAEGGRSR